MPVVRRDNTTTFQFSPHAEIYWDSGHLNFLNLILLTEEYECQTFPECTKA